MSNDEDDLKTYKKKNVRELDQIFHANGWISAGGVAATTDAYDRGYTFAFLFTDEQKAKVNEYMATGDSFEDAFDQVVTGQE